MLGQRRAANTLSLSSVKAASSAKSRPPMPPCPEAQPPSSQAVVSSQVSHWVEAQTPASQSSPGPQVRGVFAQTPDPLHWSMVQASSSLQSRSEPAQVPPAQRSFVVQLSPSSQLALLFVVTQPDAGTQLVSVQALPSSAQVTGVPAQVPVAQVSPVVHALPSSQGPVSGVCRQPETASQVSVVQASSSSQSESLGVETHESVARSQVSTEQATPSSQSLGVRPAHTPDSQAPPTVQGGPATQCEASRHWATGSPPSCPLVPPTVDCVAPTQRPRPVKERLLSESGKTSTSTDRVALCPMARLARRPTALIDASPRSPSASIESGLETPSTVNTRVPGTGRTRAPTGRTDSCTSRSASGEAASTVRVMSIPTTSPGTSYSMRVASGNKNPPGVIALTWISGKDETERERIRQHSRQNVRDFMEEPGFISIVTGFIGLRGFTVTAWEDEAALKRGLSKHHAEAMRELFGGDFVASVWTSVWTATRMNRIWVRCPSCGSLEDVSDDHRDCSKCHAPMPERPAFW